jgi:pimeloyl-ACP methyl ester carboxylesterase
MSEETRVVTGYADVNGLHMYYEIYGNGQPLVLLHGGLGGMRMMDAILPALARSRRVIVADLQAHGRTADIDRPLRFESMGDDIALLIKGLGFGKADVMGYSLGGGAALRVAIQHPEVVRKLVLVSIPFSQDGWYPEVLTSMAQMGAAAAGMMKESAIYQGYVQVAPRPEDFPVLLDKMGELLRRKYDWSRDVAALQMPVMLVYGDADSISPAYAARFYALLGGGQRDAGWDGAGMPNARLAILPATTHYDIVMNPALAPAVAPFLDAPVPEAT